MALIVIIRPFNQVPVRGLVLAILCMAGVLEQVFVLLWHRVVLKRL